MVELPALLHAKVASVLLNSLELIVKSLSRTLLPLPLPLPLTLPLPIPLPLLPLLPFHVTLTIASTMVYLMNLTVLNVFVHQGLLVPDAKRRSIHVTQTLALMEEHVSFLKTRYTHVNAPVDGLVFTVRGKWWTLV